MGDTMAVTQEIFVVEFGQESKFVFIMQELWLCVTLWRVGLSYEYMLIHLACMFTGWNVGPL